MPIERADFVSVPVQDIDRAKRFYSETLGLQSPNLDDGWPEFETGNVSLYPVDPTRFGQEFRPHVAHIALRVRDVAAERAKLEASGVEFVGEIRDTCVCHMAFFTDTERNALMLHRRYAPPER
jgi:predicted enzyme related to lactoylglutathione lyase